MSRGTASSDGSAYDPSSQADAFALQMVGPNRSVLEIGAGLTRGLAAQGCRVTTVERDSRAAAEVRGVAAEIVLGDVDDVATLAGLPGNFDVAIAVGALTRFRNPQALLDKMAESISASGRVVIVAPNMAHADLRLARLQGRHDLLPSDHQAVGVTFEVIRDMVERAGLTIVDVSRVRIPAFESGLGIDRLTVPTATLNQILDDPEAETSQFVLTALRDDADRQAVRLSSRCEQLQADVERHLIAATAKSIEIGALTRELLAARAELQRQISASTEVERRIETLEAALQELRGTLDRTAGELRDAAERARLANEQLAAERTARAAVQAELTTLKATRMFRYSKMPRAIYSALRGKRR